MDRQVYLKRMREHLKDAYLLSDTKAATMLPVFIATLQSHVDQLTALAENGDIQQLGRAGHAIKGALLNVGLTDLAQTAHALEKICANGADSLTCQELIAHLQDTVAQLSDDR
jgi:HPt (histidine-containing phosphotransfer) domain-containing protein